MTSHTADALKLLLNEPESKIRVWDYARDFNKLWAMGNLPPDNIVVWGDTPADPSVSPVDTAPHLTPFDWAIAACALTEPEDGERKDAKNPRRVTVLDLRSVERNELNALSKYPALRWLVTQREECVPWLRRITAGHLVHLATDLDLKSMLTKDWGPQQSDPAEVATKETAEPTATRKPAPAPRVSPRHVLKGLPACRMDLSSDAGHHAIANLIGPLLLRRIEEPAPANDKDDGTAPKPPPDHSEALRQLLKAAELMPTSSKKDEASREAPSRLKAVGDVSLILCDDQWHHGWLEWLCERTRCTVIPGSVQDAKGCDEPRRVATGDGLSIWVSTGPKWLRLKLEALAAKVKLEALAAKVKSEPPESPLRRRLHLTTAHEDCNEILLLDLRLFAGKTGEEAFLKELKPVHDQFSPQQLAGIPAINSSQAVSLLARTVALADPLLPVVIFSSTGRREVVQLLSRFENVVTTFAKPRPLSVETSNLRGNAEEALDKALVKATGLLRRRQVVTEWQAAQGRVVLRCSPPSPPAGAPPPKRYAHVGVYVDESQPLDKPLPFVMTAIVALAPSEGALLDLASALKLPWGKNPRRGKHKTRMAGQKKLVWVVPADGGAAARALRAEEVCVAAERLGIILRGVVTLRGEPWPEGVQFGHVPSWAEQALDREHRTLLRQCIAAAVGYGLDARRELDQNQNATLSVLTDVRVKPVPDDQVEAIRRFGIELLSDSEPAEPGGSTAGSPSANDVIVEYSQHATAIAALAESDILALLERIKAKLITAVYDAKMVDPDADRGHKANLLAFYQNLPQDVKRGFDVWLLSRGYTAFKPPRLHAEVVVEHYPDVRGAVKQAVRERLSLVADLILLVQKNIADANGHPADPAATEEDRKARARRIDNLQTFVEDLPPQTRRTVRAWLRDRGFIELESLMHDRYRFLEMGGVWPTVDQILRDGIVNMKVVDARACRSLQKGGHPLLEWADWLAYEVMTAQSAQPTAPLPTWAMTLTTGAGMMFDYDTAIERLLALARDQKEGASARAVDAFSEEPDASPRDGGGVADRARARLADMYEADYAAALRKS